MEKSTLIGLLSGLIAIFGGMILKGAPISSLNNPAAFMIIILGTFACLFTAFRMDEMKMLPKLIKMTFQAPPSHQKGELLQLFIELSQIARREGILALESDVLDAEISVMQERHSLGRLMLMQAGTYAPTLGVLGAVIGLIAALSNLSDVNVVGHAIAAAFVATILGIYTAYVLWLPWANKLKIMSDSEIGQKRMIVEGILSLQAGDSPTAIEAKLMVFIPQSEREVLKKEA